MHAGAPILIADAGHWCRCSVPRTGTRRNVGLGAQVGRSADYLSVAQFDLLSWVSGSCKGGTYEGTSYRVSAWLA